MTMEITGEEAESTMMLEAALVRESLAGSGSGRERRLRPHDPCAAFRAFWQGQPPPAAAGSSAFGFACWQAPQQPPPAPIPHVSGIPFAAAAGGCPLSLFAPVSAATTAALVGSRDALHPGCAATIAAQNIPITNIDNVFMLPSRCNAPGLEPEQFRRPLRGRVSMRTSIGRAAGQRNPDGWPTHEQRSARPQHAAQPAADRAAGFAQGTALQRPADTSGAGGQPASAKLTARISSPTLTAPSASDSTPTHAASGADSRAMLMLTINSLTATLPS